MKQLSDIQVEDLLKIVTGGNSPSNGESLVFTAEGWKFKVPSASSNAPWIIVTDPPYNAQGDGSTDDTTSIQDAIDDVAANGGGIVYFPPGTYLISQLRMKSNIFLLGAGFSTILKSKNSNHTSVDSGTSTGSNSSTTLNDTGKTWTNYTYNGYTIRQSSISRMISYNTATQLLLADPWPSTPGGVAYTVLNGKHMFILDAADVEFTVIKNMRMDGNKANQTAVVDCVHYVNLGGGATLGDPHHYLEDLLIADFSGTGITRGRDCREVRVQLVRIENCDNHGSRNLLDQMASGASDGKFIGVIAAHNAMAGFYVDTGHDLYTACKAFGNNIGFYITRNESQFSACEAQENIIGWHIKDTFGIAIVGGLSDANDTYGLKLENADHCYIQMIIGSTSGLLYTTDYGLDINSTSDENVLELDVMAFEIATPYSPGSVFAVNNVIRFGNKWFGRQYSHMGAVGVDSEHYRFGKIDSPDTNNPAYYLKTDDDPTCPIGSIEAFDGSTAKRFLTFDFCAGVLTLGGTGVTVSGVVSADWADGTEMAPGAKFASDTDTGVYRVAANNWRLVAGAAWQLDISTAGLITSNTLSVGQTNGGEVLKLLPGSSDYTYMSFYADTGSPTTLWAKLGFDVAGDGQFRITNIMGTIALSTAAQVFITGSAAPSLDFAPTSGATKFAEINQVANAMYFADGAVANLWKLDLSQGYLSALKTALAAPTFTTISTGARLVLWPHDLGASNATHAIGVNTDVMWYGVGGTANSHKWYGGTDVWMTLNLNVASNPKVKIGTITPLISEGSILSLSVVSSTSDGSNFHIGGYFEATMTANTVNSIQGVEGYARTTHTSGSVAATIGTIGNAEHNGTGGTATSVRGIQAGVILTAGTITAGIGVYIAPAVKSAGTFTTNYGIYIDAQTVGSTNYQIYSPGTAKSYLAGALLVAEDSNPNSAIIRTKVSSAGTSIDVDAAAGVAGLYAVSKAGSLRWRMGGDGTTESGSNVGNDFLIFNYSDAGSFLSNAFKIVRSSGAVIIAGTLSWGGGVTIGNSSAVVGTGRLISTSTGLTGGGDLSADRTLSIDTSVVPRKAVAETITALWTFPTVNVNEGSGSAAAIRLFAQAVSGQSAAIFRINDESSNAFLKVDASGSNPVNIWVGGALKNVQIDGSGFLKGV